MAFVRYTVTRSDMAASPTRIGQQFDFGLTLQGLQRQRAPIRSRRTSLGGQSETTYFRGDIVWSGALVPVLGSSLAQIEEFFDSVEAGETFSFDPYGGVGDSPDALRNVIAESVGYPEQRIPTGSGTPETGDFYGPIQFTFREL